MNETTSTHCCLWWKIGQAKNRRTHNHHSFRKGYVVLIRTTTVLVYLASQLHRILILSSPECQLCGYETMDAEHLKDYPGITCKTDTEQDSDLRKFRLYWTVGHQWLSCQNWALAIWWINKLYLIYNWMVRGKHRGSEIRKTRHRWNFRTILSLWSILAWLMSVESKVVCSDSMPQHLLSINYSFSLPFLWRNNLITYESLI